MPIHNGVLYIYIYILTIFSLPKIHKNHAPPPLVASYHVKVQQLYNIAKSTVKLSTPFLGTISPSHLKNYGYIYIYTIYIYIYIYIYEIK